MEKFRESQEFPGGEKLIRQFSIEESAMLDAEVPSLEAERRLTPQVRLKKRWRRALLPLITLISTMGSLIPAEALAENAHGATIAGGLSESMTLEDGRLNVRLENGVTSYRVVAPETDQGKQAEIAGKARKLETCLADPELNKDIAYLKSVYGDTTLGIVAEIEYERQQLAAEKNAGSGAPKDVDDVILAGSFDLYWNKNEIRTRADEQKEKPEISGFDQHEDLSDAKVAEILGEMPAALTGHLDEIKYVDAQGVEAQGTEASYTLAAEAENIGLPGTPWKKHGNTIIVYAGKDAHGAVAQKRLEDSIDHELLGHQNDPDTSPRLTLDERARMWIDITNYLIDPKRPKNVYIDELIPKEYEANKWDKKEMRLRQARELWAVSVEQGWRKYVGDSFKGGTAQQQPHVVPVWLGSAEKTPEIDPAAYALISKWFGAMEVGK